MTTPEHVASALATAGSAGPYFQLETWSPVVGWRPLSDLASDTRAVTERVSSAQSVLEGTSGEPVLEGRVVTSIVFLGLAARLLAPPLAAAVLGGVVPALTVDALWWQPTPGGPWPMAASPVTGQDVGPLASPRELDTAAELLAAAVLGVTEPVLASFAESARVSRQVLWGNVASGLGGAVAMLGQARADRADIAAELATRLLQIGPLRGTGELVRPDPAHWRRFFVRRSCCLFYRVPGAGYCGDCVLTPEDVRRQQWQSALRP
ncbi:MAG: hypothetical protein JWO79_4605 [Actinomycetia bacterium]|nr:hypothetical protein [Actinomycetes bacterium]MDQ1652162.1 hypothetical protein [Cryptosporangiaceae bacterium]